MRRRRRPLLGAAMIGGSAYVAGKHGQQSSDREGDQEARLQELEAQQAQPVAAAPPPPPAAAAAPAGDDLVSKIKELSSLKDAGVLTDDEFNAAKQKLLAS